MKQLRRLLATILTLCMTSVCLAYDFEAGGIYYNILSEEERTCEVTYEKPTDFDYNKYEQGWSEGAYRGKLNVPASVTWQGQAYRVIRMGDGCCENCYNLTSVTLSDGMEEIGEGAFSRCTALTSIRMPQSLKSIGDAAFAYSDLRELHFPASLERIGNYAFLYCWGLEDEIVLPDGLAEIGEGAFQSCRNVPSVTIPASVVRIDDMAFEGCVSVRSITNLATQPQAITESVFSVATDMPVPEGAVLHVLPGCRDAYQRAEGWKEFLSIAEDAGQESEAQQRLGMLDDNPLWCFRSETWRRNSGTVNGEYRRWWYLNRDVTHTYYYLAGKTEIDGKEYQLLHAYFVYDNPAADEDLPYEYERPSSYQLPVREEAGVVYSIFDSIPSVKQGYREGMNTYRKVGNEIVLYDYNLKVGDMIIQSDPTTEVTSISTNYFLNGKSYQEYHMLRDMTLCERLGYMALTPPLLMDPFERTNDIIGNVDETFILNAYYQDGEMLYKAEEWESDFLDTDTIWDNRDNVLRYARSYKHDPHIDEVMAFIKQQQASATLRINTPTTPGTSSSTYDLQGRRLPATPRRGLYLKDGRKMVAN